MKRPPGRIPAAPLLLLAAIVAAVRFAGPGAAAVGLPPPDQQAVAAFLFLYTPLFRYARDFPPPWLRVREPLRCALFTAALAGAGAATYYAFRRLPLPPALFPPAGPFPPIFEFLFGQAVLAALPEEVFFRGYLYDAFAERGTAPVAATAVLFAAAHLAVRPTLFRGLTLFPGLLFGWAREKTGTVWSPVLLHLAFNLLARLPGGQAP